MWLSSLLVATSGQILPSPSNGGIHLQEEEGRVQEEAACKAVGNHGRALLSEGEVVAPHRPPILTLAQPHLHFTQGIGRQHRGGNKKGQGRWQHPGEPILLPLVMEL